MKKKYTNKEKKSFWNGFYKGRSYRLKKGSSIGRKNFLKAKNRLKKGFTLQEGVGRYTLIGTTSSINFTDKGITKWNSDMGRYGIKINKKKKKASTFWI